MIEDGLGEEVSADGEEAGADDRHDAVDARARRPAEPKETDRYAKGVPTKAGGKRFLRFDLTLLVRLQLDHPVEVIEEKGGPDEDGAEEDTQERETFLAHVRLTSSHTID